MYALRTDPVAARGYTGMEAREPPPDIWGLTLAVQAARMLQPRVLSHRDARIYIGTAWPPQKGEWHDLAAGD